MFIFLITIGILGMINALYTKDLPVFLWVLSSVLWMFIFHTKGCL